MKSLVLFAISLFLLGSLACDRKEAMAKKALGIYTKAVQEVLNQEKKAVDIEEKDPAARQSYIESLKSEYEEKILKFEVEIKHDKPLLATSEMAGDLLSIQQDYEKRLATYEQTKSNLPPEQRFPPEFMQAKQKIVTTLDAAGKEIHALMPPPESRLSNPE